MMPHFEIHGDRSRTPLLLVHGFLSSRAQWRPNIEHLMSFCSPVIIELWGHGRSPAPDDRAAYRVDSYLEIFEKIRRSLGVERWWVCGQSFGAGLTLRYALACPERIEAQSFTNSVSALSPPDTMRARSDQEARVELLEREGVAAIETLPYHPRFARRFAPDVKQEMLRDAALISPRGVINAIRYTAPGLSVASDFGETKVPTMLINGTWEKPFQPLRQRAAELLPELQVVDTEGGHSINVEAPIPFNESLHRFFYGCRETEPEF